MHSDDYKIGEMYQTTRVDEGDVIFPYEINDKFCCMENELELVETEEERYIKNDIENTFKMKIDRLEEIIKDQALQIKYLEGQILVYEKYMFN